MSDSPASPCCTASRAPSPTAHAATAPPSRTDKPRRAPKGMAFVPGGEFMMGTDDREGFAPDDQCELFNVQAYRDRIRELAARVRIWQVRTGDTAPLPAVQPGLPRTAVFRSTSSRTRRARSSDPTSRSDRLSP